MLMRRYIFFWVGFDESKVEGSVLGLILAFSGLSRKTTFFAH